MLPRFGEAQAPMDPLHGREIVVFGYGNQGRAQALNLRDSGLQVRVAVRHGASWQAAAADGFEPLELEDGAARAAVAALLVPDEAMPALVASLEGRWQPAAMFVLAHGYNVAYERIAWPGQKRVVCVAPAGPGTQVRARFEQGAGVAAFLALSDPGDSGLRAAALAYAAGIGAARAGIFECTFRQETEVDLFGEQAVLCGGLSALVRTAFHTLVDAGYPPEMAYLECVHQVSLTAQLLHDFGLDGMRGKISPTALFGELKRAPQLAAGPMREVMAETLEEIRSGAFAREWNAASARGPGELAERRRAARDGLLEESRDRLGLK